MVLPIVIWITRDQFETIPVELEQAALVDGCTVWTAFFRIVLPIALPGLVAAFILSIVLCWNEYFFAALLTGTNARTLPCDGRKPNRFTRHQLVVDGGALHPLQFYLWCWSAFSLNAISSKASPPVQ